MLFMVH